MTLEKYNETLSIWSAEEKERAMDAKKSGDERMHSVYMMKASMLGDMLKALGRFEMECGQKGLLEKEIVFLTKEAERLKGLGDYDAAERASIKAETIQRARRLIYEEEEE